MAHNWWYATDPDMKQVPFRHKEQFPRFPSQAPSLIMATPSCLICTSISDLNPRFGRSLWSPIFLWSPAFLQSHVSLQNSTCLLKSRFLTKFCFPFEIMLSSKVMLPFPRSPASLRDQTRRLEIPLYFFTSFLERPTIKYTTRKEGSGPLTEKEYSMGTLNQQVRVWSGSSSGLQVWGCGCASWMCLRPSCGASGTAVSSDSVPLYIKCEYT